jgi:cytochrome P450
MFEAVTRKLGDDRLRQVEAPMGGAVWVVNDAELAAQAFADPLISSDPEYAPTHWQTWDLGVQPPSAVQPSLTTLDGAAHRELRRAHGPLFTTRRLREHAARAEELAVALLGERPADLTEDFTTRYPLAVVCELLGVPADHLDEIVATCRRMLRGEDVTGNSATMVELVGTGNTGLDAYSVFGLVFAGQVTTEAALGFVVAHLLAGHRDTPVDDFVRDVLRRHPPAPYSLWRFTSAETRLGGHRLPPRTPVLVDIAGINAQGHDVTFGGGPHYCVGAQLALLELTTVVRVLERDFPDARLAVPFAELPVSDLGVQGARLTSVPVRL